MFTQCVTTTGRQVLHAPGQEDRWSRYTFTHPLIHDMSLSLSQHFIDELLSFSPSTTPSDPVPGLIARQPVHTVYGGAQLFTADISQKLGRSALETLRKYGADCITFARVLGLPGSALLPSTPAGAKARLSLLRRRALHMKETDRPGWLAWHVYERVVNKLTNEPVEDYRIDFEDGFGYRTGEEEDEQAQRTAREVARGMRERKLPPMVGIRIRPLAGGTIHRALRTLDMFLNVLLGETGGGLPAGFVITLPKVSHTDQVRILVRACAHLETALRLRPGILQCELMVETPRSLVTEEGNVALPGLVKAGEGRCVAVHFGAYDFTAACDVAAPFQTLDHPLCDGARALMSISLAGSRIRLSDGATATLPVGPHAGKPGAKPLTRLQAQENRDAVHHAWRLAYNDILRSLHAGFYQGWDLHPAQLPVRYAAMYAFFLDALDSAAERLNRFVARAARATRSGGIFDDAATGQGLLNFFQRGLHCGALTADDVKSIEMSPDEIHSKSFVTILEARRSSGLPRPNSLNQDSAF